MKNLFALNVKIFFLLGIFFSSLHAQDDWTSFYQAKYLEEIEGDFSQALEIYEKLLLKTQDPSLHAIVRYRRARLAELRRDYAFAKKELEELRHCGEEPATTLASERLRFLLEFLASQEIQKTQSTIQELQNELEKLKTISRLHQFESRSIQQQIEKLSQTFHQTLQKFEDTPHTDALKETLSILFEKIQKSQWSEMEPLWKNADSLLQKMKGSSEESKEIRSILSQIQDWIHQQTLPLPPPLSKKIPFSSEERFLQVKRRIRNLSDDFHYLFEHDYAGAQRLLEEIQRELFAHEDLEGEESFRKFFQESKDSLEKFQQALDQVLQHTTQRLAGYDQGNFILKNYREHSVLAELTTGAEYLSHQKGKEGFSDLFYQIPSVSKGEGTEKLIQLIRACFPTYWEHSQAYIRFHKGELHVSQEHSINDSIHSFLKSLGFPNPSPLNLQLTLVAYGNGDLDSFTSTFPVSEIRALHPEGYGLALESVQKKDFFERFLSRSGLPRFQSDILPLKYFRESTIQLYETHEAIVAYRAIQQHFQEVREKYQTGIQLKLIPLPHRSGNLTLSLNLSNQLLKLPLPTSMTERGLIHLTQRQLQKVEQPWFLFGGEKNLVLLGLRNPFSPLSSEKENLLLYLQIKPQHALELPQTPSVQTYELLDFLEIPENPAPRMKHSTEFFLSKKLFLSRYFQRYFSSQRPTPLFRIRGERLEVQGEPAFLERFLQALEEIRRYHRYLIRFEIYAFSGKQENFPFTYLKHLKESSFRYAIRNHREETLNALQTWGKPFPLSSPLLYAGNTQLVHSSSIAEISYISHFSEQEGLRLPQIESVQHGIVIELRPLLHQAPQLYFQLKISGALIQQIEQETQKIAPLGLLQLSRPLLDTFEGEWSFEIKKNEVFVLVYTFSYNRAFVLFLSPSWIAPQTQPR